MPPQVHDDSPVARWKLTDAQKLKLQGKYKGIAMKKVPTQSAAANKGNARESPATPKKRPSLAPSSVASTPRARRAPSEVSSATSRGRPPKLPSRQQSNAATPVPRLNRPSFQGRRSSVSTTTSVGAQADVSSIGTRAGPPKLPPRPKGEVNRRASGLKNSSSTPDSRTSPKKLPPKQRQNAQGDASFTSKKAAPDGPNATNDAPAKPKPKKLSTSTNTTKTTSGNVKQPSQDSKARAEAPKAASKNRVSSAGSKPKSTGAAGSGGATSQADNSMSKAPPKKLNRASNTAAQGSPASTPRKSIQGEARRPSLKPTPSNRRVSFKDDVEQRNLSSTNVSKLSDVSEANAKDAEQKRPSLGGQDQQDAQQRQKPLPKKKLPRKKPPSKPSRTVSSDQKPQAASMSGSLEQTPADKLAEEDRDLKSVLTEEQRGDLTLLIADITSQMRLDIENHFDASKGLKLIKDDNGQDILDKDLDFDPGTVDVGAYDKERKLRDQEEKQLAKPETQNLKESNLAWYDEWREVVLLRVGEAVNSKATASEQKDEAAPEKTTSNRPAERIQKFDTNATAIGPKLEEVFPRVKTSLTKLPMNKRSLVLHSILLLLLSLEHYNAASRVLLLYLTSSLKLGLNSLRGDEEKTAQGLLYAAQALNAEVEARKHQEESATSSARKWKIRLATAAGAAVIGYTGGLAAPMIAAGVGSLMTDIGLGATAAAGYLGTVASNATVVGTLFGAYGGRMTGQVMENISAGVQDFGFLPLHGERKEHVEDEMNAQDVEDSAGTRRLRVVIAISGWLLEKEEVVTPWKVLKPSAEVFALRWELEALMNLGQSFDTMLQSAVYGYAQSTVVKQTVFAEVMNGMMWPMALTKVARVVDNPFNLAKIRADKAGKVLADALINHVQGERPVTLIGYSLGARVIWSCLTTLAEKKAFGLVESAVLMGSPIGSDTTTWRLMRSAVVGRLVNVYSANDYLLAFLYRASSLHYDVAGLVPVTGLAGVENVDVTEMVSGHLRYRYLVGAILQKIRFEDVDKDEVAKEAQAFEKVVEEEKERTYFQQAGELYQNYKGKKPEYKGKKKPGKAKLDMSDADAEKEASKMEKTVGEKTEQSLMEWAAEQLYLSAPAQQANQTSKKDQAKTQQKVEKSTYQWAKDSIALSRSGGAKGEKMKKQRAKSEDASKAKKDAPKAAKDKPEQGKKAGDGTPQPGYFASATSYLPSMRSSPQTNKKTPKPKKASAPSKDKSTDTTPKQSAGYSSYLPSMPTLRSKGKATPKDVEESKAEDGSTTEVPDDRAENAKQAAQEAVTDSAETAANAANEANEAVQEAVQEEAADNVPEDPEQAQAAADEASQAMQENIQAGLAKTAEVAEQRTYEAVSQDANEGFSRLLRAMGGGGSSQQQPTAEETPQATETAEEATDAGDTQPGENTEEIAPGEETEQAEGEAQEAAEPSTEGAQEEEGEGESLYHSAQQTQSPEHDRSAARDESAPAANQGKKAEKAGEETVTPNPEQQESEQAGDRGAQGEAEGQEGGQREQSEEPATAFTTDTEGDGGSVGDPFVDKAGS